MLTIAGIRALPSNAKMHYNLAHVSCGGVADALAAAAAQVYTLIEP